VAVILLYQTTSKEYVEFLRDANTTNSAGQTMYDLWAANGRSAPVVVAGDSMTLGPIAVLPHQPASETTLSTAANPFRGTLELSLMLARRAPVTMEIFDPHGRRVWQGNWGTLESGTHRLAWDGHDAAGRDVGAGAYWVRVRADGLNRVRQVVRLP